jgi:protein-disulfide isomerase
MLGGPGAPRLVLFVSPTCSICQEVKPSVPAAASSAGLAAQLVHDPAAEQLWNVPGTPFAVVMDETGVVRAKGTVNNLEQLEGLVDTAERRISEDLERRAG